jgi:hypothetical protein
MPIALSGVITSGGIRVDGPGRLRVFLDDDPSDFGLRAAAPFRSSEGRMWSGLTDAVATDEADDSYDLSWLNEHAQDRDGGDPAALLGPPRVDRPALADLAQVEPGWTMPAS